MHSLVGIWPPYGVRIRSGDLVLSAVGDEDIPGLVRLILDGVHDPATMPFFTPWTDAPRSELPGNVVRFYSAQRSELSPQRFSLPFAVRWAGELVGVQSFDAEDFSVTRTGETGSWLGQRFQRRGIGTAMRRAVCAFAFDWLGATEVTSSAFLDNAASLAVSRRLGYRTNGVVRRVRRPGELAVLQRLVLTPETFRRGEPIQVDGAAALRAFLQLD